MIGQDDGKHNGFCRTCSHKKARRDASGFLLVWLRLVRVDLVRELAELLGELVDAVVDATG